MLDPRSREFSDANQPEQIKRLEHAVWAMACWLVEAQTGFVERDVRAIREILDGKR
jgi:hypothetical protein